MLLIYTKNLESFFGPNPNFEIKNNPYAYDREEAKLKISIQRLLESIQRFKDWPVGLKNYERSTNRYFRQ